jgi:hypothetical protein
MVLQALRAELFRCRGGHLPALQAGVEAMTPEAQRLLLVVLRDLRQEADAERSKRRQGRCW